MRLAVRRGDRSAGRFRDESGEGESRDVVAVGGVGEAADGGVVRGRAEGGAGVWGGGDGRASYALAARRGNQTSGGEEKERDDDGVREEPRKEAT